MTKAGKMSHAPYNGRGGCGENLAWHSSAKKIGESTIAADLWYNEVTNPGFDFTKKS